MNTTIGSHLWACSSGWIPPTSIGHEPEMTSREVLSVLNASEKDADIQLSFYFEEQRPAVHYSVHVQADRLCIIRVNDLIDPEPIPLGVPFGVVLRSTQPVVVDFQRFDSRPSGTVLSRSGWSGDNNA